MERKEILKLIDQVQDHKIKEITETKITRSRLHQIINDQAELNYN